MKDMRMTTRPYFLSLAVLLLTLLSSTTTYAKDNTCPVNIPNCVPDEGDVPGTDGEADVKNNVEESAGAETTAPRGDITIGSTVYAVDIEESCVDVQPKFCPGWATAGDCDSDPLYMHKNCRKSCKLCEETINPTNLAASAENEVVDSVKVKQSADCIDFDPNCSFWASKGECETNEFYMFTNCEKSCHLCLDIDFDVGVEQETTDSTKKVVSRIIRDYNKYLHDKVAVIGTPESLKLKCANRHKRCAFWASSDQCEMNQNWMGQNCALACQLCGHDIEEGNNEGNCVDIHEGCSLWAETGECDKNPVYMLENCKRSCNICLDFDFDVGAVQVLSGAETTETVKVIRASHTYLRDVVIKSYSTASQMKCRNSDELCAFWATKGECESNKKFMPANCALACRMCDDVGANVEDSN